MTPTGNETSPPFVIAQLSDPHILAAGRLLDDRIDTAGYFQAAVAGLRRLPLVPDVLLITGDLVNEGHPDEYAHLGRLLADVEPPVLLLPGNHDDPTRLVDLLAGTLTVDGDALPVRVVTLDTNIAHNPAGRVGPDQLRRLDRALAARPDHPTIVALHHPPFTTMIGHMDAMGLRDADALAEVIARHPQVQRIVCGHMHRLIVTTFAGVPTMTCPSTAHAVAFDLTASGPPAWSTEPPGMLLHCWRRDAGLVTHHVALTDWTGPHPFGEEPPGG